MLIMSWRKAKQEQEKTEITPGKLEQDVPMQTQAVPSTYYPATGAEDAQPPISNQPGLYEAPTAPYVQTPQSYQQSSTPPLQPTIY